MTMEAKLADVTPACFGMAHGYQNAALASAVVPDVDQQQTSLGHFLRIPMQCRMGPATWRIMQLHENHSVHFTCRQNRCLATVSLTNSFIYMAPRVAHMPEVDKTTTVSTQPTRPCLVL